MKAKYLFGDIVVVDKEQIGVVLKTWFDGKKTYVYEIYVRSYNYSRDYEEKKVERYRVRHKYLDSDEIRYQNENF